MTVVIDDSHIYEQRILIFFETKPQSNKYRQLRVNAKQFKDISDAIGKTHDEKPILGSDNHTTMTTMESTKVYDLPDLQSSYLKP